MWDKLTRVSINVLKERVSLLGRIGKYSKGEDSYEASLALQRELYGGPSDKQQQASEEVKAVLEHFDLSDQMVNVKVLHNVYIKNLRFMSYDPETGMENLKKVLILSDWLLGPEIAYKHSQIYYEIGKAQTTLISDYDEGRAFMEKGREV